MTDAFDFEEVIKCIFCAVVWNFLFIFSSFYYPRLWLLYKLQSNVKFVKKETLFKKSELSSFAPVSGPKCFWEEIVSARHIRCFCKAWSYTTDSMQMSVSLSVLRQPLFTIFTFTSQTQGRRVLSTSIAHGVEKQIGR